MKIWLDARPTFRSETNPGNREEQIDFYQECKNECECVTDNYSSEYEDAPICSYEGEHCGKAGCLDIRVSGDEIQGLRSAVDGLLHGNKAVCFRAGYLQQAASLFIQQCAEDRWFACNSVKSGRVVVIDAQGKLLLEQFRTPSLVAEVVNCVAHISVEMVKAVVALFYKEGLLQIPGEDLTAQKRSVDREILTAWLHVTNVCNLRCHYCYLEKTTESMTEDISFRAVDAIFRSASKQGFKEVHIRYAGGEASLRIKHVCVIHDYAARKAQEHGLRFQGVIFSNGIMITQQTIEQLKLRNVAIMISLDGINEFHDSQRPFIHGQGSFKYVDRTIDRLLQNKLVPSISVTASKRNLAGLPQLLEYILQRDLPFTLNYYRDNECAKDSHTLQYDEDEMISAMRAAFSVIEKHLPRRSLLSSLIDKSKLQHSHQHTCSVGRSYMVIDQRGGVAKCHVAIKQTVTTIDADDPLRVIQQDRHGVQNPSVEEKEGCRTCAWRYWCTGGCPLLTYKVTKRYDVKSPNCHIYQALFPVALRIEALRLLKYTTPLLF